MSAELPNKAEPAKRAWFWVDLALASERVRWPALDAGVPGLCVHPSHDIDNGVSSDMWTLTHVASGRSLVHAPSIRDLMDLAQSLAPVADWTETSLSAGTLAAAWLLVSSWSEEERSGDSLITQLSKVLLPTPTADLRVVHMPGRMGGEATIGDTRITCRNVAGRVWAGETVADLADDFGITRDQVRLACWWLIEHAVENDDWEWMARETWEAWAERWETLARNGDGDRAGDPTPEHQSDWADWAKR